MLRFVAGAVGGATSEQISGSFQRWGTAGSLHREPRLCDKCMGMLAGVIAFGSGLLEACPQPIEHRTHTGKAVDDCGIDGKVRCGREVSNLWIPAVPPRVAWVTLVGALCRALLLPQLKPLQSHDSYFTF